MLENICSKKVAYLIGYLSGDGNYENGNGKRTDRLSVTTTDKETMDWMIETFNLPEQTRTVRNNNESQGIYASKDAYVKTFPTSYSEEFNKFGILCKKDDRMIHNINKSDMKYWLLGFLDSDGMISWSERKDRDRIAAKVSFTHPSAKLLERVQTFLRDELNIPSSIKPKGTEKCFVLSFSKISDVKRFGDYVYSDKLAIVLKRKYNKYLELYNGSSSMIDLTKYTVKLYLNGSSSAGNSVKLDVVSGSGTLEAGGIIVLKYTSAALELPVGVIAYPTSACNFNGDDAITLEKDGIVIDVFGEVGVDPGNSWSIAGSGSAAVDKTVRRISSITQGNANWSISSASEWIVITATDDVSNLGAR